LFWESELPYTLHTATGRPFIAQRPYEYLETLCAPQTNFQHQNYDFSSKIYFIISLSETQIIIHIIIVPCHMPFVPGTSLEPAVIPIAQASSFTLQYFPYYV